MLTKSLNVKLPSANLLIKSLSVFLEPVLITGIRLILK